MHGQICNQYVQDDANLDRCQVIKRCQKLPYSMKEYLNCVRSPHVRSILTKLRLDTNCTLDSQSRSYRGKKPIDTECKTCKTTQSVQHILFECKMTELCNVRNVFEQKICDLIKEYRTIENGEKLRQVLSIEPDCQVQDRPEAQRYICTFVKDIYNIVNQTPTRR